MPRASILLPVLKHCVSRCRDSLSLSLPCSHGGIRYDVASLARDRQGSVNHLSLYFRYFLFSLGKKFAEILHHHCDTSNGRRLRFASGRGRGEGGGEEVAQVRYCILLHFLRRIQNGTSNLKFAEVLEMLNSPKAPLKPLHPPSLSPSHPHSAKRRDAPHRHLPCRINDTERDFELLSCFIFCAKYIIRGNVLARE